MKNTKHIILTSLMGLLVSTAYAMDENAVVGHVPVGQHAAAQIQNPQMISWEAIDRIPHGPNGTLDQHVRHEALVAAKINAEIAATEHAMGPNPAVGPAGLSWKTLDRMPHGPDATAEQIARHDTLVAAKINAEIAATE
ncbi:MAG: hypothetical protein NTW22_00615, partial [Proteobacteria bacterium]|nr:hypothetical protein [Pseudomonadota bacterium]